MVSFPSLPGVKLCALCSWWSPSRTDGGGRGQVAGCQVRLSLLMALPFPPTEFQDDTRLNHDALPERTVVQLDASPR